MTETTPADNDEQDAILRCRGGESAAFRLIVERYGGLLFATAYLMLRDRGQAEDATQEALLAGWRGIETFDLSRPVRPWLLRILVNHVLKRRRRRLLALVPLLQHHDRVAGPGHPLELQVVKDWERDEVRSALNALPADSARVVILRYFAELSLQEIGEVLALPEGTVKSRLHRALKKLERELTARQIVDKAITGRDAPTRGK